MNINIPNNVAGVLYWEIFLMGLFSIVVIGLGFMWLFLRRKDFLAKVFDLAKKATGQTWMTGAASALVAVIAIYPVGAIFNTFSDDWIDRKDPFHLYMKRTWIESKYNIADLGTDNAIKIVVYGRIYGLDERNPSKIIDRYYRALYVLWEKEVWRNYILYSQRMVNFSRVWCLAFCLTIPIAIARIPVSAYRWWWAPRREGDTTDVLLSLIGVAVTVAGYYVGGVVWQNSEVEVDNKIFGVYRSLYGAPKDFDGANLTIRATHLDPKGERERAEKLEASDLCYRDGRLFVVDDKDNYISVYNTDGKLVKFARIPDAPLEPAKFEAICYRKKTDRFYVFGAHRKDRENSFFAFELQIGKRLNEIESTPICLDETVLAEFKECSIMDEMGVEMNRYDFIEGAAVVENPNGFDVLLGLRNCGEGPLVVLRCVLEKGVLSLEQAIELTPDPDKSRDRSVYHLSAIATPFYGDLIVLAASEGDRNRFFGNRLFRFRLTSRRQVWKSSEFSVGYKAEGVAVWNTESGFRTGLVFDNDYMTTNMRSLLTVIDGMTFMEPPGE